MRYASVTVAPSPTGAGNCRCGASSSVSISSGPRLRRASRAAQLPSSPRALSKRRRGHVERATASRSASQSASSRATRDATTCLLSEASLPLHAGRPPRRALQAVQAAGGKRGPVDAGVGRPLGGGGGGGSSATNFSRRRRTHGWLAICVRGERSERRRSASRKHASPAWAGPCTATSPLHTTAWTLGASAGCHNAPGGDAS
mmetsp:Transcript_8325/g.25993  ORF Transcript_8325/g.25993 Transcript_8325/m.25993 type:complete len:202 (-) Transcript_8325:170-775(-)